MGTTTQVHHVTPPPHISHSTNTIQLRGIMSTAPDDQAPDAPLDTIECKACHRSLATISFEGDLSPVKEGEYCDSCENMMPLYTELQGKLEAFKALEHRRSDYGPREWALQELNQAQVNFRNFIESAMTGSNESGQRPGGQNDIQDHSPTQESDVQSRNRSRKRSRSLSSSPAQDKPEKRPRLSDRKRRVSFDPSVVFRDVETKRFDSEFNRNSEGYSPGRYAASEDAEMLDTSGCSMRETQFFGLMKRGQKWVPTPWGMQMDEEWEMDDDEDDDDDGDQQDEPEAEMNEVSEQEGHNELCKDESDLDGIDQRPASALDQPQSILQGEVEEHGLESGVIHDHLAEEGASATDHTEAPVTAD
ncbi:hypothetical protein N0V90_012917 [Kalmusia sp. IMI 367209]|nr:hypothetical protein N0V90_012917 [Kalmusia sp. IMI 367209]